MLILANRVKKMTRFCRYLCFLSSHYRVLKLKPFVFKVCLKRLVDGCLRNKVSKERSFLSETNGAIPL